MYLCLVCLCVVCVCVVCVCVVCVCVCGVCVCVVFVCVCVVCVCGVCGVWCVCVCAYTDRFRLPLQHSSSCGSQPCCTACARCCTVRITILTFRSSQSLQKTHVALLTNTVHSCSLQTYRRFDRQFQIHLFYFTPFGKWKRLPEAVSFVRCICQKEQFT